MTITNEKAIVEIWQLFRETDARLDKLIAETDARMDKRSAETDKKINKLASTFGQQWGKLIEALVRPDSIRLFQERGIQIEFVSPRVKRERGRDTMEIDLLLLNKNELVVIEVKSRLRVADVNDLLEDLADFKDFFPEYKEYHVYGGVAGLDIVSEADKFAYRKGLFVLAVTGQNLVEIRNNLKFKPRDFGISA